MVYGPYTSVLRPAVIKGQGVPSIRVLARAASRPEVVSQGISPGSRLAASRLELVNDLVMLHIEGGKTSRSSSYFGALPACCFPGNAAPESALEPPILPLSSIPAIRNY